jgi:hypothetical protein
LVVLDRLPSDEGMLSVEIELNTSDSTKSAFLMTETFSGENWYNRSPVELSIGQKQDVYSKQVHHLSIQRLRHDYDKMQFYFVATEGITIDVKSLKIIAHTINRK